MVETPHGVLEMPEFGLSEAEKEYHGPPDDRRALMAHRKWLQVSAVTLLYYISFETCGWKKRRNHIGCPMATAPSWPTARGCRCGHSLCIQTVGCSCKPDQQLIVSQLMRLIASAAQLSLRPS